MAHNNKNTLIILSDTDTETDTPNQVMLS